MAAETGNTASTDDVSSGGVRRRHSTPLHLADLTASHPDRPPESHSTETGPQSAGAAEPHRVRFSIESHRRPAAKKRRSDELTTPLMIDTRAAAIMSGQSVTGEPPAGSPSVTFSAGDEGRNPFASSSSPASPRNRSRGLSLRSSVFARAMGQRASRPTSGIELEEVGTGNEDIDGANFRSEPKSKHGGTSVTVSPVIDYDRATSSGSHRRSRSGKSLPTAQALPRYQEWFEKQARTHLPLETISAWYVKSRKFILRIQDIPPSKDGRHIDLNPLRNEMLIDERTKKPYVGNSIRSSKYTAWNFLPKQLFAQFSKFANFYFLCVSILQMIPGLSTTGQYTTIVPLLFFVSVSMAKEGYEDLRRYRLDKAENNREVKVMHAYRPVQDAGGATTGPIHWAVIKWHSLKVGDIIRLDRDEAVPADIVLLNSRGPNNVAYIETMALDGETNLKNKQPPATLIDSYDSEESIAAGGAHFVVEDPNLDLYNLEGKVTVQGKTAPLTNNEIIYRGSILRNTPQAIGMVIYSGEECKIRMNANKDPRVKAPSLQSIVNKIVLVIALFVLLLSLFNTLAYMVWRDSFANQVWYLKRAHVGFGPVFTSFIIMFNTLIPLSLYVSLEIVKVCQMIQLNDIDMYDEASNTPLEARTSTINEELGQVSYIFSDKTGTLTENVMRFRKLSVAGTSWIHDSDLKAQPDDGMLLHKKRKPRNKGKKPMRRESRKSESGQTVAASRQNSFATAHYHDSHEEASGGRRASHWTSSAAPEKQQAEMSTAEMIHYITHRPNTAFAQKAKMMLLSMALCHTCLPERIEGKVSYQASSPDELALVDAAKELGYIAWDREVSKLTLKTYPNGANSEPVLELYEVLDIIEFSSKRKRMSVVVRFPDGRICVMCKGADSIIMKCLKMAGFASKKLQEIERRVVQRKSMEAQQAILRKSSQMQRDGSIISLPRTSTQLSSPVHTRASVGRLGSIHDVDDWLRDRETDVRPTATDTTQYEPRPSAQIGRNSVAVSEHAPEHDDDEYEELVEEDMVQNDAVVLQRCLQHITDFATEGLRTLLYAHRFLSDEEYRTWQKVYHDATTSLVDRQTMIEKAGEMIERDLDLGGATAIEDKLQKGVPETIDRLRRANISMWMLTGDKRETAINIGHSCRLIKDYSAVTILDYEAGDVEQNIAAAIMDIQEGAVAHSVTVVDGQTLAAIESDKSLNALFLDLAILVDSVICCRASPSQKAGLVAAIRRRVNRSVTLAIGDGANDIAMIQEAHVGIGITGKEGLQAARVSDYSIAQFRFLTKLLLVHGRWNYIRTCKYTVGTFWKELLFYLTQAMYQRSTGYSGTSLYESWSLTMFNTLFTSLPVIFLGIFEQDLRASTLIAVPELYTKGQRGAGFNLKVYLGWMFTAASESVIVYYIMFTLYATRALVLDNSLFSMGNATFTICVILVSLKLQIIEQRFKSTACLIAVVLSVGGWFLWNIILALLYGQNHEYNVKGGLFHRFGRDALWWLIIILAVSACGLLEVALRSLKPAFFPTDVEIFQTLESDLEVRKRFEESSSMWMQAGWHRGSKKSSIELQREAAEQAEREGEVQKLLDRPRTMEEGAVRPSREHTAHPTTLSRIETEVQTVFVADGEGGAGRKSTAIQDMLHSRLGSVRQGSLQSPSNNPPGNAL